MIKFKDINYPRRKEIIINLPNEIWKGKIIKIYNGTETIYNSVSAIYNCLYGKSKTCGGYEWIKR